MYRTLNLLFCAQLLGLRKNLDVVLRIQSLIASVEAWRELLLDWLVGSVISRSEAV